jgi:hypothetical protein
MVPPVSITGAAEKSEGRSLQMITDIVVRKGLATVAREKVCFGSNVIARICSSALSRA